MRHRRLRGKLNRTSKHRASMFANMAVALIQHEQITTTLEKAKQLRPIVERMVTAARVENLHVRRRLLAKLGSVGAVNKLFASLSPRYAGRPGGYTRIMKYFYRPGDMANRAVIEFVDRDVSAKGSSFAAATVADC